MADKCGSSPYVNGEHDYEPQEIEIIRKHKQITVMKMVCRWCGKQK